MKADTENPRYGLAARCSLLILTLSSATHAQCARFTSESIFYDPCVFTTPGATAFALSPNGAIAGMYDDCNSNLRPFLRSWGGNFDGIAMPGATPGGRALGINSAGKVVGYMYNLQSEAPTRPFSAVNGVATDLGALTQNGSAEAKAVSENGLVVGWGHNPSPVAVFWDNGGIHQLTLPMGPSSGAEGTNDSGHVCGWMGVSPTPGFSCIAFVWQDGVTTPLPVPADVTAAVALGMNNLGDACGIAMWPDLKSGSFVRRACAWISGQFVDLGLPTGMKNSRALDINDAREVVGDFYDEFAGGAFLWREGTMTSLQSHIPLGDPELFTAHAINNKGQIAGEGGASNPPRGVAFLLTPTLPQTPGDTNCDSAVNVTDLLAVISSWSPGPVGTNPADLNRDNQINVTDLLAVILNWG